MKAILFLILFFSTAAVHAQLNPAIPLDTFSFSSMEALSTADKSWSLNETVYADRQSTTMKGTRGKNILVYQPDKKNSSSTLTAFNHGNVDMELQFMLAKGSAATVLFQGLYAIHLKDNWGEKNVTYNGCGGITLADQSSTEAGNEVRRAPLQNACHAPGLWQKLQVSFTAPAFNQKGEKISNARFSKVVLNGVTIHENIELPVAMGITEKAIAPFIIKASDGPVAFRNLFYLPINNDSVKLRNIAYKYYEVKLNEFKDFTTQKIVKQGNLDGLTWASANNNDGFVFEYTGTLEIPATNLYHLQLVTLGGGQLTIDGQKVIEHIGQIDHEGKMSRKDLGETTIQLQKGTHPFRLVYFKNTWAPLPVLGLFVQGRGMYRQALQGNNSYTDEEPVSAIVLKPANEPLMQRGFLRYKGKRKMYCISVGDPSGIHYSVDLSNGALLQVWKGGFADVTGMWHERGNQILEPLGNPLIFDDKPQWALAAGSTPWPDTLSKEKGHYRLKGYSLDAHNRPQFQYTITGLNVTDTYYPEESGKILTRNLSVNNTATDDAYFRIVTAKVIQPLSNGEYNINDGSYIIRMNSSATPLIRETKEGRELVVPVKKTTPSATINYSIIW